MRHRIARPLLGPLLGIALAALATAGCSGASAEPAPLAGGGVQTRIVTDAKATQVQVPAQPQRVLALSEPTLDGALALGVSPVGTTNGRGQSRVPNYLGDRARNIPV